MNESTLEQRLEAYRKEADMRLACAKEFITHYQTSHQVVCFISISRKALIFLIEAHAMFSNLKNEEKTQECQSLICQTRDHLRHLTDFRFGLADYDFEQTTDSSQTTEPPKEA